MIDSWLGLADGRRVAYTKLGDPAGVAVLFFHGAPSCRLSLVPWADTFAQRGLRVFSPDRPGYGGSSPQPGRRLCDWAADVAGLADALGLDRFAVAGHSSGGPYAVACAALLPERVTGAVVAAGVTDMGWPPAWRGIFPLEAELMRATDEQAAAALCARLIGHDGSGLVDSDAIDLAAPDATLLSDPIVGEAMGTTLREAFRQGVGGYAQDAFLQGRAWTFEPQTIAIPMVVAHGELDTVVPEAHSRHTAALISGAALHLLPNHGHVSILGELPALCAGAWASRTGN